MFSVESRRHFVWQTPGTVSSLPLTSPVSLNPKAWKAGIKSDPDSHTFIRLGIFSKNHLFTAHTKNSPKEMLICSTFCDILKIPASYGVMQGRLGFYPGKIPPGAIKHFYGIMMLADFFGGKWQKQHASMTCVEKWDSGDNSSCLVWRALGKLWTTAYYKSKSGPLHIMRKTTCHSAFYWQICYCVYHQFIIMQLCISMLS